MPRFSAMVEKARKALPLATKLASRCGRKRVGVRAPGGEAQRHSRINEKVERDIKESAAVSRPRCTRNCAIEPIGDAVCDQQGQCDVKLSSREIGRASCRERV